MPAPGQSLESADGLDDMFTCYPQQDRQIDNQVMSDLLREIRGLRRDMQVRDLMNNDPELRKLVAKCGLPASII